MFKNHQKIYTKPPNGGYGNKHRDLSLLETWPRYWQKGRIKGRPNSLHVFPRLKSAISVKDKTNGPCNFVYERKHFDRNISLKFNILFTY